MHRARFVVSRHDQEVQRVVVVMHEGAMDTLHYELTVVRLAVRAKIVFVHVTIATISPAYKNILHAALQFYPHAPFFKFAIITLFTVSGGMSGKYHEVGYS